MSVLAVIVPSWQVFIQFLLLFVVFVVIVVVVVCNGSDGLVQ